LTFPFLGLKNTIYEIFIGNFLFGTFSEKKKIVTPPRF